MMAAEKGDHELVKLLLDFDCKVNLKNSLRYLVKFSKDAVYFAVDNSNNSENVDIVLILLKHGADANAG